MCMVRPLKMVVLLLSVRPLLRPCMLRLHPTHLTDIPVSISPRPQLVIVLIKGAVRGVPHYWFPW